MMEDCGQELWYHVLTEDLGRGLECGRPSLVSLEEFESGKGFPAILRFRV